MPLFRACRTPGLRVLTLALFALLLLALPGQSADAADKCLAVAEAPRLERPVIERAGVRLAQLKADEVRFSYIGHSTFQIDTPGGISIATDYNDYVRPAKLPDVVTMNRAHNTHYTDFPDPAIKYVLRGWNPSGGAIQHDVTVGDVRIRNVPTNIRDYSGGTYVFGNSIFIFEVADLCIAHLGHLHHTLTDNQYFQVGQIDVVMVPVDGSFTLDVTGMVEVLTKLRAPLMLPMHYFSSATLNRFLDRARSEFDVRMQDVPTVVISRATLPKKPQILVLPGH
jgi:L-ascorbate metabolism protein UlaG (beta-lactamase superfamily)